MQLRLLVAVHRLVARWRERLLLCLLLRNHLPDARHSHRGPCDVQLGESLGRLFLAAPHGLLQVARAIRGPLEAAGRRRLNQLKLGLVCADSRHLTPLLFDLHLCCLGDPWRLLMTRVVLGLREVALDLVGRRIRYEGFLFNGEVQEAVLRFSDGMYLVDDRFVDVMVPLLNRVALDTGSLCQISLASDHRVVDTQSVLRFVEPLLQGTNVLLDHLRGVVLCLVDLCPEGVLGVVVSQGCLQRGPALVSVLLRLGARLLAFDRDTATIQVTEVVDL